MDPSSTVDPVTELPLDLDRLVEESLRERFGAVAVLRDRWRDGSNRFDQGGEALFAARTPSGSLAGVCGLNLDPYVDDPGVGRLRHLYLLPPFRRQGIATALVGAVIHQARGTFRVLRLRTDRADADALYTALGFERCSEPDCTHVVDLSSVTCRAFLSFRRHDPAFRAHIRSMSRRRKWVAQLMHGS